MEPLSSNSQILFVSDKASWALDEVASELMKGLGGTVTSGLRSRLQNPKSSRVFLSPDIFSSKSTLYIFVSVGEERIYEFFSWTAL